MTQTQIIINVLKSANDFIPAYKLEKENTPYGWIGTAGGRRARELAEKGLLEKKYQDGYVFYKWKENKIQTSLI